MGKPEPFFVVLRLDKDQVPYVEGCYETENYASLRVKHLAELDGVAGYKQRIEAPYLHPISDPERFMLPRGIAMTWGRGQELIDYSREYARLTLGEVVDGAWLSWREGQAARGNLEEAAQDAPSNLRELFEEHAGTLKLHPQDLP